MFCSSQTVDVARKVNALHIQNYSLRAPNIDAALLRIDDWVIQQGEWVHLVGDSSSGKTSFLLTLLAHARVTSWVNTDAVLCFRTCAERSYTKLHQDCDELRAMRVKYFGVVFQDPRVLFFKMSNRFAPTLFRQLKMITKNVPMSVLESAWTKMGFSEADKKKRVQAFSSGMIARAALLVSMIHEPEFLIWDEAFSHLDRFHLEQTLDFLFHFKKRPTILFTEHSGVSVGFSKNSMSRVRIVERQLIKER